MRTAKDWQEEHSDFLRETPARVIRTGRGPIECASFGGGPSVLSLHGALGGFDQSLILARTVGEPGYRYIAVSRPGYLNTPIASGRLPEEEADLLASLLDALGVPDVAVLAVSGGGPSAIHFALRHPDRCRGLVLISTASGVIEQGIPTSFKVMKLLARVPFIARQMQRQVERNPLRAAGRSIADEALCRRTLEHPHAGPLLQALVLSTADRMNLRLAGTDRDIWVTRTREYPLEALAVPVLAVQGTADDAAPFSHAERLLERVPRAELLALDGGGHAAIFTHNDEVRPRVARFFAETAQEPRYATRWSSPPGRQ
jgi:pimeloyl-ACP methyl ester carboxylesterase